jgi:hypothetical protein
MGQDSRWPAANEAPLGSDETAASCHYGRADLARQRRQARGDALVVWGRGRQDAAMIATRARLAAYVLGVAAVALLLGLTRPVAELRPAAEGTAGKTALASVLPLHQVASPVADRRPAPTATPAPPRARPEGEAALHDAWYSNGCYLDPGTPPCLMVSMAAQCALDPAAAGCRDDRDGDGYNDVAEFRAGFDPANAADCLGSGDGEPAINCLFLFAERPCNGHRDTAKRPPVLDCALFDRNPACDGFAR